ncbi:phenylalanine-4-hydroxylase [Photobacterium aphoticum]|uniref:Phenylalanine-4-hydroxylase n=1 Tax=Photobacterium aphoticum TaxID=754436 RepID=A0A090QKB4_9GAMM|nr:phenylalanine-4-hydroxylase [Photobacterium aphoticum]
MSSPGETQYALRTQESDGPVPLHKPFDPVDVMRTPYRIDIMQPVYFVLDDIQQLYDLAHTDVMAWCRKPKQKACTPHYLRLKLNHRNR